MECLICVLKADCRSSLKAREAWHISVRQRIIFKMILSQPFIKGVITAEIQTEKNASGALDQDQADGVSGVSSSRVTSRNPCGPFLIQWMRLKCNDLYPSVSSKPLIED